MPNKCKLCLKPLQRVHKIQIKYKENVYIVNEIY